jgi:hypothetical protein
MVEKVTVPNFLYDMLIIYSIMIGSINDLRAVIAVLLAGLVSC